MSELKNLSLLILGFLLIASLLFALRVNQAGKQLDRIEAKLECLSE